MEKIVSATEFQEDPDAVLRRVNAESEVVLVDSAGAPTAALISLDAYRRFRELEQQQRRREAFAELERIRSEIDERLGDLTADQRDLLAEEISEETETRIVARIAGSSST